MNETQDYVVNHHFEENPSSHCAKLYDELKHKYGVTVIFEPGSPGNKAELLPDVRIRGEVIYLCEKKWVIKLNGFEDPDIDRVISHELLHIVLRYRNHLPYADTEKLTKNQIIALNAVENRIIEPALNKIYGQKDHTEWGDEYEEILNKMRPYLSEVNGVITRDRYLEVLGECLKTCGESLPPFLL